MSFKIGLIDKQVMQHIRENSVRILSSIAFLSIMAFAANASEAKGN